MQFCWALLSTSYRGLQVVEMLRLAPVMPHCFLQNPRPSFGHVARIRKDPICSWALAPVFQDASKTHVSRETQCDSTQKRFRPWRHVVHAYDVQKHGYEHLETRHQLPPGQGPREVNIGSGPLIYSEPMQPRLGCPHSVTMRDHTPVCLLQ